MSPWELFVSKWRKGCGSEMCPNGGRKVKVCLARGSVPCDVLFIGEAPGESENSLGQPFVGPAGQLLDVIIRRALPVETSHALTNLVCCIPRDEGGKAEVQCCSDRLVQMVELCRPKLIVCVGRLAKDWLDPGYKKGIKLLDEEGNPIRQIDILHPAAILRGGGKHNANVVFRGLAIQRAVIQIQNAVEDL
jgi:uracil-DNA glycosylase family 4